MKQRSKDISDWGYSMCKGPVVSRCLTHLRTWKAMELAYREHGTQMMFERKSRPGMLGPVGQVSSFTLRWEHLQMDMSGCYCVGKGMEQDKSRYGEVFKRQLQQNRWEMIITLWTRLVAVGMEEIKTTKFADEVDMGVWKIEVVRGSSWVSDVPNRTNDSVINWEGNTERAILRRRW